MIALCFSCVFLPLDTSAPTAYSRLPHPVQSLFWKRIEFLLKWVNLIGGLGRAAHRLLGNHILWIHGKKCEGNLDCISVQCPGPREEKAFYLGILNFTVVYTKCRNKFELCTRLTLYNLAEFHFLSSRWKQVVLLWRDFIFTVTFKKWLASYSNYFSKSSPLKINTRYKILTHTFGNGWLRGLWLPPSALRPHPKWIYCLMWALPTQRF